MRTGTGKELQELREKAGLNIQEACLISDTPIYTWRKWELDPSNSSYRRPSGMVFAFLKLYIKLRKLELKLKELQKKE